MNTYLDQLYANVDQYGESQCNIERDLHLKHGLSKHLVFCGGRGVEREGQDETATEDGRGELSFAQSLQDTDKISARLCQSLYRTASARRSGRRHIPEELG